MTTLYETLGVDKSSDKATIRNAYLKRAKKTHPDRGGDADTFRAVVKAYGVLSDDEKRAKYDRTGDAEETVDNAESNAMTEVMMAIDAAWQRFDSVGRLASTNIVAEAVSLAKTKFGQLKTNVETAHANAKKIRKFAKRFKVKKGDNRIARMLEGRAADMERQAATLDVPMAALKRAIEILNDHEYEFDREDVSKRQGFVTIGLHEFKFGVGIG